MPTKNVINVLMADDDPDDRHFFEMALNKLAIPTTFHAVTDGEELIEYLLKNKEHPPHILFLDINMPRKNGYECLREIKANEHLKRLPVVMYSTSLKDAMADMLYQEGAHYYLCKSNLKDLVLQLQKLLPKLANGCFHRPKKGEFIINGIRVI